MAQRTQPPNRISGTPQPALTGRLLVATYPDLALPDSVQATLDSALISHQITMSQAVLLLKVYAEYQIANGPFAQILAQVFNAAQDAASDAEPDLTELGMEYAND